MPERVVVGMSGGVDSSVAAALLVEAGYDVVGVSLRLWDGGATGRCCSLDDFLDARRVAHRLRIPYYVMDFQAEFERCVVRSFVDEYAAGRTPNPCVRCNQFIKFGSFWKRVRELGGRRVATGHYARVSRRADGEWRLRCAADPAKDQSYFLFALPRQRLPQTLFPIGHLSKTKVRAVAGELGLPVAGKAESQEVCFAPGRAHGGFVAGRLGRALPRAGLIVDEAGLAVGEHGGVHTVTIGQRRGLGLHGHGRRYVVAVDRDAAVVRVGPREALRADGLEATGVNWMVPAPPPPGSRLVAKIRSRHPGAEVEVVAASADRFVVRAPAGLDAVTPGQAAVLYAGEDVVGGGWIERAIAVRETRWP